MSLEVLCERKPFDQQQRLYDYLELWTRILKSISTVTEDKRHENKFDIQRNRNIFITSEKCAPFLITSVERRILSNLRKKGFKYVLPKCICGMRCSCVSSQIASRKTRDLPEHWTAIYRDNTEITNNFLFISINITFYWCNWLGFSITVLLYVRASSVFVIELEPKRSCRFVLSMVS